MFEALFGIIIFVLDVYAIFKTVTSTASTMAKVLWVIAIIVLPVVGFIAWLLFGPRGASYSRA